MLTRRHLLASLPVIGAGILGVGFSTMLGRIQKGGFDPHAINNPLTGKLVPDFSPVKILPLSDVSSDVSSDGADIFLTPALIRQQMRPVLLNFLASWCVPCILEIPFLQKLSQTHPYDLALWGIAYKDKPDRIRDFLQRNGQPYDKLGNDQTGQCAIDWGVTGVPESFLILPGIPEPDISRRDSSERDSSGANNTGPIIRESVIAWHGSAALDESLFKSEIEPHLRAFQAASSSLNLSSLPPYKQGEKP